MIIHSPIISGSLTFADGSTFTLPDGGNYSGSFSGSIQISEVQSHLIPDTTEVYDLGSETNRFRDIYLSDATIRLGSGKFGITGGIFQMTNNDDVPMSLGVGSMQLKPVGFPSISLTSTATGFNLIDEDDEPAPMQIKSLTIKSASNSVNDFSIGSNNGKISFTTYGSGTCATYRLTNNDVQENLFFSYTDCNGDPVTSSLNTNSTTTLQALEGSFQRTSGTDDYRLTLISYDTIESAPVEVAKLTITGSAGGGTIVSTDSGVKITDPEDETQPGQVEIATITLTNESGVAGTKVTANAGTGQVSFTDLFDNSVGIIAEQVTIPPASGSSSTTTTVIRQKETADGGGVSFFEVSSSQCARYRIINHSVQQNLFFNYTDCDGNPVSSAQILTSTSDIVTMQMGSFQRTGGGSDHYDIKLLDYVNADYAVAEIKQLEISTTGSSDNIVIRLDDTDDSGTPKLILTVSGSDTPADLQTGNIVVSGSNGTSTITNDLPGEGLAVTDATGSLTPIKAKTFELEDPDTGDIITLSVSSGSLNTTATNSSGSSIPDPKSNLSGSFTGSLGLTGDITSVADCVKIGTELNPICDIYATRITGSLSGTVNGINIVDVKTNVDAILSGSAADKDSFAEIVTLINSVDTTNDSVFAGFVTSSNAAQAVQDGRLDVLELASSSLDTHISDTNNPHSVTATQVGLGNVDNTSDANKPISTATQTALDLKATVVDLNAHEGRTDNPHSVTKAQVGLGNVDNTSDANKPVSTATQAVLDSKLSINGDGVISGSSQVVIGDTNGFNAFSSSVSDTFDGLSSNYEDLVGIPSGIVSGSSQIDVTATTNYSTISSHISSTSNPHSVTATQVGLGNVDNTSDADKPISTATQTALNLKATVSDLNTEKGRIDSILASSDADKDSFAEIVTLINSVDTTNDSVFAGFVTSSNAAQGVQDGRLTALEAETGSIATAQAVQDGRLDTLENTVGNLSTDYGDLENIPAGIVSSSAQISNYNTFLEINGDGVISGSSQVIIGETTGFNEFSSSVSTTFDGLSSNYVDLVGIPVGIISGSSQISITAANISDVDAFSQSGTYASLRAQATTAGDVGLGNVTNESKATMFTSPTITGTISNSGGAVVTDEISITSGGVVRGTLTGDSDGLYLTAPSGKGIGILTDGANDGMIIQSDGSTVIYGSLALENIPLNGSSDFAVVVGNANTLNYRQLGSNAFTSDSYVTTTSAQAISSASNALTFAGNVLTLTRGDGSTDTVNLSAYLDDTNLARIISGTYDSGNQELVFTRDDSSTFTIDASMFFDDTNLVTSVGGNTGDVTATQLLTAIKTVDGAGSGLDADLLDGLSSASFIRSDANDTASGIITLSNSTASISKTSGALVVTGGVGISGALNVGGDVVAYASSDKRLKDNIVNIENPIEKVQKLNGVTWDWNSNADELQQSLPNVGVIAQEVEEVFPQLVHDRENGYKGVDYAKLTGLLIEAVKEQQKQIDELKSRLG